MKIEFDCRDKVKNHFTLQMGKRDKNIGEVSSGDCLEDLVLGLSSEAYIGSDCIRLVDNFTGIKVNLDLDPHKLYDYTELIDKYIAPMYYCYEKNVAFLLNPNSYGSIITEGFDRIKIVR